MEAERKYRDNLINAYDNSIRYTDGFLSRLIRMLEKQQIDVAMLYTSDHGEDIFDDSRHLFLHASPVPSYYQLQDVYKRQVVNTSSGSLTLNPAISIASATWAKSGFNIFVCQSGNPSTSISNFTIPNERLLNTIILIGNLYCTTVSKSPKAVSYTHLHWNLSEAFQE